MQYFRIYIIRQKKACRKVMVGEYGRSRRDNQEMP